MMSRIRTAGACLALVLPVVAACDCGGNVRLAAPQLVVSPTGIDFGGVVVGETADVTVELHNPGNSPLTLGAIALEALADGTEQPLTLVEVLANDCLGAPRTGTDAHLVAAGGCARVTLRYAPLHATVLDTFLRVPSDDPSHTVLDVPVSGHGDAPVVEVCDVGPDGATLDGCTGATATPSAITPGLDFGAIPRRTSSARTVRVKNLGTAPLVVVAASLVPASPGFSLPAAEFAPTLAPGESATLVVTFTPPAAGAFTGTLRLETNDPEQPTVDVPLAGTGTKPDIKVCVLTAEGSVDEAACSQLSASPPAIPTLMLPPTPLGTSTTRTLRVIDAGVAALTVTSTQLETATAELAVTPPPLPATVAPAAFLDIAVTLAPAHEGAISGSVKIASDDDAFPLVEIPIAGSGIAPALQVCVVSADGSVDPLNCSLLRASPPMVPGLDFGHVAWFAPQTRKLRTTNLGAAPLSLQAATLATAVTDFSLGANADAAVLAPGASRDLDVVFTPVGDGALVATVHLVSNDPVSPDVSVPLAGFAEAPKLCATPATLAFGTVAMLSSATQRLTLRNCGLVPYDLTGLALAPAGPFTLSATPTPPLHAAPGAAFDVDVKYLPTAQRADAATITITSTYRTITVPVTGTGGPASCQSAPPIANAGPDQTVRPLVTATLDGTRSSAPRGGLTYQWRVVTPPRNGNTSISGATTAHPTIPATLAGDYVLELVARDQFGCASAADTVVVHVVPDKRIHVQLTWPEDHGDVDLHYVGPGGALFNAHGDTFWSNRTPDWGANNTVGADGLSSNNPSLDVDDTWGNGPENVNQNGLFDGTYKVAVHFYCSRQCYVAFGFLLVCPSSEGPVAPTVKVFVDGVQRLEVTRAFSGQGDLWEAAKITISGGGTVVDVAALNVSTYKSSSTATCSSSTN